MIMKKKINYYSYMITTKGTNLDFFKTTWFK